MYRHTVVGRSSTQSPARYESTSRLSVALPHKGLRRTASLRSGAVSTLPFVDLTLCGVPERWPPHADSCIHKSIKRPSRHTYLKQLSRYSCRTGKQYDRLGADRLASSTSDC